MVRPDADTMFRRWCFALPRAIALPRYLLVLIPNNRTSSDPMPVDPARRRLPTRLTEIWIANVSPGAGRPGTIDHRRTNAVAAGGALPPPSVPPFSSRKSQYPGVFVPSVPGGEALSPVPPDDEGGTTVVSVVRSEMGRPSASQVQASARSCSIFCDASIVATVVACASWFIRIDIAHNCASASVPMVVTAVATSTSISENPRATRISGATRDPGSIGVDSLGNS